MKKPDIQQVYQAGSFLLCVFLALQITSGLEGTEFSGGWLTGPLLSMEGIGAALFMVTVVLTLVFPRVAAAIGFAASALCLPLYSFFIAPVPFSQIFARGHEFKVQRAPGFQWHMWPVTEAGYMDAEIFEEHDKGWICGIAKKPINPAVSAKAM